jgi:hypothetical protein
MKFCTTWQTQKRMTEILINRFRFMGISRLHFLETSMDLFNTLNILTLFGILFLSNSRFILSPGVEIELPQSNASATKALGQRIFALPLSWKLPFAHFSSNLFKYQLILWPEHTTE